MNNLFKNKKAEKLRSIWWIGVWLFVMGSIISGVLLFYGAYIDVKSLEAESLANKVSLCLIEKENLDISPLEEFDFFTECKIYKPLFEANSEYFVLISLKDSKETKVLKFGNNAFEEDCKIEEKTSKAKYFPNCAENQFNL